MDKRFGNAFLDSEQVYVCMTTMHHRRFVEDLIHVVGMPMGAIVRLRYRRKYVSSQLWGEVGSSSATSAKVLIVLGGTDSAGKTSAAPLRRGRVISAGIHGSVLVLDVALEDFVFESSPGRFYEELKLIGNDVPSSFGSGGSNGSYLQKLKSNPTGLRAKQDVEGWEKVTEAFWSVDALIGGRAKTGVPFLFYICPSKGKPVSISKDGRLTLEMIRTYYFDVHTSSREGGEAFKNPLGEIVFEFSNPSANFISSRRVRIDSRRDLKSVGIATAPLFRVENGHLSVRTVGFEFKVESPPVNVPQPELLQGVDIVSAKDRKEVVLARYDFPLRIGRVLPYVASAIFSLAAGAAIFKIGTSGELNLKDLAAPALVALLGFIGLSVGLKKQ